MLFITFMRTNDKKHLIWEGKTKKFFLYKLKWINLKFDSKVTSKLFCQFSIYQICSVNYNSRLVKCVIYFFYKIVRWNTDTFLDIYLLLTFATETTDINWNTFYEIFLGTGRYYTQKVKLFPFFSRKKKFSARFLQYYLSLKLPLTKTPSPPLPSELIGLKNYKRVCQFVYLWNTPAETKFSSFKRCTLRFFLTW